MALHSEQFGNRLLHNTEASKDGDTKVFLETITAVKTIVAPAAPEDVHPIIFAVDGIDQAVGAKKFLHFHARSIEHGDGLSMTLGNILLTNIHIVRVLKLGEAPPFGVPTPSRLIDLIGPEKDLFLQGRRCENRGYGIGAFAYYRRVVERQKNRIIERVKKVAERIGARKEVLDALNKAMAETRFKE